MTLISSFGSPRFKYENRIRQQYLSGVLPVKPIKRDDYVAKLIHIKFDCGQSCVFHSCVENNDKVSESLAQDVAYVLR